jgi:sortase A
MTDQPYSQPKHVNPTNQGSEDTSSDLAAEVIRQKISSLYVQEAKEHHEPNALDEEHEVARLNHRSKHQKYMYDLTTSGKSQPEIQTAWHQYYLGLPDDEKHQVWEEFYSESARAKHALSAPQPAPVHRKKTASQRTVGQVKKQLLRHVDGRSKLKAKHHLQSIIFGLGIGAVAVTIMLFGFFNERIIAPFVTPSRTVSNTPIIADASQPVGTSNEVIIPKINVQIPVIYDQKSVDENAIQNSLENGVVHYSTTSSPGEQGNTVIFGHSSNNILNKGKYKFAFVLLNRLEIGDTFTLTKNGKRYVYRVYEKKVVKPTDVSVLGPTDKSATATLITCDPPGTSINRLVVIGEQISPSPTSNVASTAVKSDQTPTTIPSQAPSLWQHIMGWFTN